jgi:hypothetical protein
MDFAMVPSAKRNRELIADFTAQCWRLRKPEMMRIRGAATTHEAWLLGNRFDVFSVTDATRNRQRQLALIYLPLAFASS